MRGLQELDYRFNNLIHTKSPLDFVGHESRQRLHICTHILKRNCKRSLNSKTTEFRDLHKLNLAGTGVGEEVHERVNEWIEEEEVSGGRDGLQRSDIEVNETNGEGVRRKRV